jgi:hypothetical protein
MTSQIEDAKRRLRYHQTLPSSEPLLHFAAPRLITLGVRIKAKEAIDVKL